MKNRLREAREEKGISQEELSEKSGISRTTISELETEKKEVTTNITLEKIATALGEKVSNIFFIN
ncbi:MAG TPA: helix-turn-helix transcriptional regulator [Clostridiaceae bacterium]|jgi:DNA-binding XRE family transcriptional regulator|nr:helix-turn-helix transcriptional regulator [Clostridiaceae bacterium]